MNQMLLFLAILISSFGYAQENPTALQYGKQVTAADLKEYLSIIASDALEGRKTGSRGQKMAAAFISNHFQEIGLTPPLNNSYYQPIDLYSESKPDIYVVANGFRTENNSEVAYWGSSDSGGEVKTEVIFVGQGREMDYTKLEVNGKSVVIWTSGYDAIRVMRQQMGLALSKGAKMIFFTSEDTAMFQEMASQLKSFSISDRLSLTKPDSGSQPGIFLISPLMAEKIFAVSTQKLKSAAFDSGKKELLRKVKKVNISYQVALNYATVKSENVLGYLEGTDKKNELIIVTAHYDHIGLNTDGEDKINNGADDDGSGTVTVLELAKLFAKAKQEGNGPRRSMLFMTVTGEEEGLLGSEYYVEHPVYPLASTVVDLNIDMIGRTDTEHKGNINYVYVIGSDKLSTELHKLSEKTNATYTKLSFDYTYNDENHPTNLYKRSDHWNFAKNGIPIIFYFDGIHEDYHLPSDEVDKIDFDLLAKRAQCIFYTAWEVANREERIAEDKK